MRQKELGRQSQIPGFMVKAVVVALAAGKLGVPNPATDEGIYMSHEGRSQSVRMNWSGLKLVTMNVLLVCDISAPHPAFF